MEQNGVAASPRKISERVSGSPAKRTVPARSGTRTGRATKSVRRPTNVKLLHLDIALIPDGLTDREALGEWDARSATIHYDSALAENVMRETLLHEILHAVFEHTDVSSDQHEDLIRAISPMLLQLIRNNKKFIGWLQN